MLYAAAARANAGLAPTIGVSQSAGVVPTGVVDLTDTTDDDDDDLGTILVPKVEVEDIPITVLKKLVILLVIKPI